MHYDCATFMQIKFRAVFRKAIAMVKWQHEQFSLHSFRSGAASSAVTLELDHEAIQTIGC